VASVQTKRDRAQGGLEIAANPGAGPSSLPISSPPFSLTARRQILPHLGVVIVIPHKNCPISLYLMRSAGVWTLPARTLALVLVKRIWISRNLDEWLSASESPSELRIGFRTSCFYFSIAINMNEHPATTTSPSPPTSAPVTRVRFHHARPLTMPAPTRSKFQKRAPEARKYYLAHAVVLYCLRVLANQTFPLRLPRLHYDQAGKEPTRPRIRGKCK
jgi:hypothetical protein